MSKYDDAAHAARVRLAASALECSPAVAQVMIELARERWRQDRKWGRQDHADGTGPGACWMYDDPPTGVELANQLRADTQRLFAEGNGSWLWILLEEIAEAFAEDDVRKLRHELVQVGAVAASWIEAIDRRTA